MSKLILLTGAFPYTEHQIAEITEAGCKVVFMQNEADTIPNGAENAEMVVCNGLFLKHDISQFEYLKFIQLTSAGLDRVPLDTIKERGLRLYNARGVYCIPMAEWAVMQVLNFYKATDFFQKKQTLSKWEKNRSLREINGITVGIVGAGSVGCEVAKRFEAFGAHCVGYDVFVGERPCFEKVEQINCLSEQVGTLDVLVLTAPHTPETHHMIDRELILAMKKDSVLVNIARGGLINETEMIDALKERKDIHASLDVFEVEPIVSECPLWSMENVTVTPHNSFVSNKNNERLFNLILSNIKDYIAEEA